MIDADTATTNIGQYRRSATEKPHLNEPIKEPTRRQKTDSKTRMLTWYGLEEKITNILMVFPEKRGLSSVCQYKSRVCDSAHT